jgi:hypothetical protein
MSVRSTSRTMRRAWVCVILIPVGVILAFAVGETLPGLMGYGWTHESLPLGPTLLVAGVTAALFCVPGGLAAWFGLRARREGDSNGLAPALIGLVCAGYFLVTGLIGLIGTLL